MVKVGSFLHHAGTERQGSRELCPSTRTPLPKADVRLVADLEVLEVDDWTSRGQRWQHDGRASRIAQEERSLPLIKSPNQGYHELLLPTYTHAGVRRSSR